MEPQGISTQDRVIIFDTTLRDGEQSPGATMNEEQKVRFARQLARLGVDVIEAGFAASSEGDFAAIQRIAEEIGNADTSPIICSLARTTKPDIDRAIAALAPARRKRVHIFIATSDLHIEKKLRTTREQVLQQVHDAVTYAMSHVYDVEFSCEDATRSDLEFMCEVITVAVAAGATTINIPDTVGYATPTDYAARIAYVREHVPGIEACTISVHCHNDLGMAVANSLMGVMAGARQIECTINGIGERAGNASLEEVVMALRTRPDVFNGLDTAIDATGLGPISALLTRTTGQRVQPNKAIVGANAFAHEAGIHQDGMIKDRSTYEIMKPEHVGWTGESMVMGKHSGRAAFIKKLEALGFLTLNPDQISRAFRRFKALCDAKKDIYDEDIYAIVEEDMEDRVQQYTLTDLDVHSRTGESSGLGFGHLVEVALKRGEETFAHKTADGDGPVDALYLCIRRIVDLEITLREYTIDAISPGGDAQGRVNVCLVIGNREIRGHGTDTNILVASAKAYLSAVNRFLLTREAAVFAGAAEESQP